MDDGDDEDDEDGERLQKDAEIMEEVMEGEIDGVVRKVKPVRQALFKVSPIFFFFLSLSSFPFGSHPRLFFFLIPLSIRLLSIQPPSPPSIFYL